jgi:hypothetical protein
MVYFSGHTISVPGAQLVHAGASEHETKLDELDESEDEELKLDCDDELCELEALDSLDPPLDDECELDE